MPLIVNGNLILTHIKHEIIREKKDRLVYKIVITLFFYSLLLI